MEKYFNFFRIIVLFLLYIIHTTSLLLLYNNMYNKSVLFSFHLFTNKKSKKVNSSFTELNAELSSHEKI